MRPAVNPARLHSFSPRKARTLRLELAFLAVRDFLSKVDPSLRFARLKTDCQVIVNERRVGGIQGDRSFMHTGHFPNVVCAFPGCDKLGEQYLFGLLLHEFGHLGAGLEHGERAADQWILDRVGIRILYLTSLDIEAVDGWAIRRILKDFTPPRRNPPRRPRRLLRAPTRPRP